MTSSSAANVTLRRHLSTADTLVVYNISVVLQETSFTSASQLYNTISQTLSASVTNGTFTANLHSASANTSAASLLAYASSSFVQSLAYVDTSVDNSPTLPPSSDDDNGLSDGDKIGIGVGIAVGVVLFGVLGYLYGGALLGMSARKERSKTERTSELVDKTTISPMAPEGVSPLHASAPPVTAVAEPIKE